MIADTRTNLDWLWNALFYATSRADEQKMALRAYSDGYVGYQYVGKHWLPPFGPEILAFVSGWTGNQGWVGWLNGKIGGPAERAVSVHRRVDERARRCRHRRPLGLQVYRGW